MPRCDRPGDRLRPSIRCRRRGTVFLNDDGMMTAVTISVSIARGRARFQFRRIDFAQQDGSQTKFLFGSHVPLQRLSQPITE